MIRKDTRPITVNGQPWEYKIGRNTVAIYDTQGKPYYAKFTEIVDEKSVAEKSFYLNPAVILNHILSKILGGEAVYKKCYACLTVKPDVYLRTNPFAAEIHEDYTKHYICNDCCASLAEEI